MCVLRRGDPIPSTALDSDSQAVMDCLRQIVHALETGSRAAQRKLGLSGAQLFILETLAVSSVMSVNELASKSRTHQSSVSVVVSRLVQAKLVRGMRSASDARRVELTVTSLGRRLLKTDLVTPQRRLSASLNRLSPERLAQLRVLLEEVVSLSEMDSGIPPMFFEEVERRSAQQPSPARSGPKGKRK